MDDWEYSDETCPKCSADMATRTCGSCGGEGWLPDDEEDTYVGWGEGEERCDNCNGQGHETWCRDCGWDANFKCFLSAEYERKWREKEASASNVTARDAGTQ